MELGLNIFVMVISYLLGSIPFGLLLAKFFAKIDITKYGSGNIGATNVLRICGKRLATTTLVLDALKGVVAVLIAKILGDVTTQSIAAFFVVIGHTYSYWLKFKGGKGVATSAAVYLVLAFPVFIFMAICWFGIFRYTRIVSLASVLTALISLPIAIVYTPFSVSVAAVMINVIVIVKHKENIIRLLNGTENKFAKKSE